MFYFNYIHDLESIWWILIWTLLTYQKVGDENYALESNADVQRRTRAAERIFHTDNLSTHIERSSLLKCSNFETFTEIIPSFFKGLIGVAATFKERLVSTYKEEEGKSVFPIKLKDDGLLHWDILDAFKKSAIEYFDVVYINDNSSTDSEGTPVSSKRSTREDIEEERPSKRAR